MLRQSLLRRMRRGGSVSLRPPLDRLPTRPMFAPPTPAIPRTPFAPWPNSPTSIDQNDRVYFLEALRCAECVGWMQLQLMRKEFESVVASYDEAMWQQEQELRKLRDQHETLLREVKGGASTVSDAVVLPASGGEGDLDRGFKEALARASAAEDRATTATAQVIHPWAPQRAHARLCLRAPMFCVRRPMRSWSGP